METEKEVFKHKSPFVQDVENNRTVSYSKGDYKQQAIQYLRKISRAAKEGVISISSEDEDTIQLNAEYFEKYLQRKMDENSNVIPELKRIYRQAECLEIEKLVELKRSDIQTMTEEKFTAALDLAFEYKDKNFKETKDLKKFILDLIRAVCGGIVVEDRLNRTSDIEGTPYTKVKIDETTKKDGIWQNLDEATNQFYESLFRRLANKNADPIITAAWIEYRINFTDHFFWFYCEELSFLLAAFVLMRKNYPLPSLEENLLEERKKCLPDTIRKTDDEENDENFKKWLDFYWKMFEKFGKKPPIFKDPRAWEVKEEGTVEEIKETYFDTRYVDNIIISKEENEKAKSPVKTKSPGEYGYIKDVFKEITDAIDKRDTDIICFKPQRCAMHEIIILLTTEYKIANERELKENFEKIFFGIQPNSGVFTEISQLGDRITEIKETIKKEIEESPKDYFSSENKIVKTRQMLSEYSEKIKATIKNDKYSQPQKANLVKLIVFNKRYNEELSIFIREVVRFKIEKIQKKFPEILEKMTYKNNLERISWVIVGGPASGKTKLSELVVSDITGGSEDTLKNTCKINPDYYKKLLFPDGEEDYQKLKPEHRASAVHEESSIISKKILSRLEEILKNDEGPDVLFDVVKPSPDKLKVASLGGATVNIYAAACPVDIAIYRAYARGGHEGRYVPTKRVLEGHQQQSFLMPIAAHEKNVFLHIYDTNISYFIENKIIASVKDYSRELFIYDFPAMLNFVQKTLIDVNAANEEKVYSLKDRLYDNKIHSLMKYVEYGLSIRFEDRERKLYARISQNTGLVIIDIRKFINNVSKSTKEKEKRKDAASIINAFINYSYPKEITSDELQKELKGEHISVVIHVGTGQRKVFIAEKGYPLYISEEWTGWKDEFPELIMQTDEIQGQNLYEAVARDDFKTIKDLLNIGLEIEITEDINAIESELNINLQEGKKSIPIAQILEQNTTAQHATYKDKIESGWTLMHEAAASGSVAAMYLLLKYSSINVNTKAKNGHTPLFLAAYNNHIFVVEMLVEKGADPTITTNHGHVPLYWSSFLGNKEMTQALLKAYDNNTKNPIFVDNSMATPLHLAARNGHLDLVDFLISTNRFDVNAKDNYGLTPLHMAAHHGKQAVVQYLLKVNGIALNEKTGDSRTPLDIASEEKIWGVDQNTQIYKNKKRKRPTEFDEPLFEDPLSVHKKSKGTSSSPTSPKLSTSPHSLIANLAEQSEEQRQLAEAMELSLEQAEKDESKQPSSP